MKSKPGPTVQLAELINNNPLDAWLRSLIDDPTIIRTMEHEDFQKTDAFRKWRGASDAPALLTKREFYRIYLFSGVSGGYDQPGFYRFLVTLEALVTESEQKRSGLKYPLIETRKGMILMTPMSWWRNFFYGE